MTSEVHPPIANIVQDSCVNEVSFHLVGLASYIRLRHVFVYYKIPNTLFCVSFCLLAGPQISETDSPKYMNKSGGIVVINGNSCTRKVKQQT